MEMIGAERQNEIIRHSKEYPYQPESEECSIPQTESDILKRVKTF